MTSHDWNHHISDTWHRIQAALGPACPLEPLPGALTAHAHRAHWFPAQVRVLLLAESHVWTTPDETRATVLLPAPHAVPVPDAFVRLVYCLGYGEKALVAPAVEPNSGTWQYWQLFAQSVASTLDPEVVTGVAKGKQPVLVRRVANKLAVLAEMQRRGIWLADASLTALYPPGGKSKPPVDAMRKAVTLSWRHFWNPFLARSRPAYVLVIGKMVHGWLADDLREAYGDAVGYVHQPAAFLTKNEKAADLEILRAVCDRFAAG